MKIAKIITGVIITILAFDFFWLVMWILSGQHPGDGLFFGKISFEIINLIIK